jgi:hypothetical protein
MAQAIQRDLPAADTESTQAAVIVRTSFITQLRRPTRVDSAVLDTLRVLGHTVADFAALPDLRIVSTGAKSAMVLISAIWPEKLTVKMTGLATSMPQSDDAALLIISAKITTETAPVARELADALLGTFPVTIVSRITTITPPLVSLVAIPDTTVGAEHLVQPRSFDPSAGVTLRGGSKPSRVGWSVVR